MLQSPAVVLVSAGLMFFGTFFAVLGSVHFAPLVSAHAVVSAEDDPSWKFRNPDLDQWINQLKNERASLALREQQLKEWEARLAAETKEIATVTQAVYQAQQEFDRRVVMFKDQEIVNSKKQAKLISSMSPEAGATMLSTMPEDEAAKILYLMKQDVSSVILDAMSQKNPVTASKAAAIAKRMKDILPISSTNNPTSNASR